MNLRYPFPRHDGRRANRVVQQWWHETDRRVEDLLNRSQVRTYRALSGQGRYDDRSRRYDRRRY